MTWLLVAALLAQTSGGVQRSARLTAAAEQLLDCEKKIVASSTEHVEDVLFVDVLALLDLAVEANPANLHARAVRSELLLHQSYDGEAYDVCYLLDARDDANLVVSRASNASAADITKARSVLKRIDAIPPDAIPDPPSICDDDDEGQRGTRTKNG